MIPTALIVEIFEEVVKTVLIVVFATYLHVNLAEKAAHDSGLVMVKYEEVKNYEQARR